MQIGNQMCGATDWASMHRERMNAANAGNRTADSGEEKQDRGMVSFRETLERTRGARLTGRMDGSRKAPYSYLADENGEICYNGVTFCCDYKKNRLCLGDVSDMKKCISVGLSGGGSLVVNRDNLEDLARAIGMFSPEDVNRIMRAIAQDKMCQSKLQELDEEENSIGEAEDDAGGTEDDASGAESVGEGGKRTSGMESVGEGGKRTSGAESVGEGGKHTSGAESVGEGGKRTSGMADYNGGAEKLRKKQGEAV